MSEDGGSGTLGLDDVAGYQSVLSILAFDSTEVHEIPQSGGVRDLGWPAQLSARLGRLRRLQLVFVFR